MWCLANYSKREVASYEHGGVIFLKRKARSLKTNFFQFFKNPFDVNGATIMVGNE